jgi:hypothetical protein
MAQTIAESLAKIEAMFGSGYRAGEVRLAPRTPETSEQMRKRAHRQREMAHGLPESKRRADWANPKQDDFDLIEGEDY